MDRPRAVPASSSGGPNIGKLVFFLSLAVLYALRSPRFVSSPRRHIYLRIGVLGLCLAGLVFHITARVYQRFAARLPAAVFGNLGAREEAPPGAPLRTAAAYSSWSRSFLIRRFSEIRKWRSFARGISPATRPWPAPFFLCPLQSIWPSAGGLEH